MIAGGAGLPSAPPASASAFRTANRRKHGPHSGAPPSMTHAGRPHLQTSSVVFLVVDIEVPVIAGSADVDRSVGKLQPRLAGAARIGWWRRRCGVAFSGCEERQEQQQWKIAFHIDRHSKVASGG